MIKDMMTVPLVRVGIYLLPLVALAALFYLMNTASPVDTGPLGILTVFALLYLFWLGVFFALLHGGIRLIAKLVKLKSKQMSAAKSYYIASIVAFVPVMLLGMQSVGQLEVRDVLLVGVFVSLAIFFVVKRL